MLALASSSCVAPLGLVTKVHSIPNFRDLGGMPCAGSKTVRPNLLLRSADLEDAVSEDLEELKRECPDLRVIDLRGTEDAHNPGVLHLGPEPLRSQISPIEVLPQRTGTKRLVRHVLTDRLHVTYPLVLAYALRYVPLRPLNRFGNSIVDNGVRRFLDTIELSDVYWWMLMEQGPRLAEVIRTVAKQSAEGKATLIHCAHGKDRTGVATALLLAICGVSHEDIAKDYSLSSEYGCSGRGQAIMLQAMPERYRERIGEWAELSDGTAPPAWQQFGRWCDAEEGTMLTVLKRLERKYGSVDSYLEKVCGITEVERTRLREQLTC